MKSNNFDLLRFILASIVFFFHTAILSLQPQIQILKYLDADFAVQAFFAVSGYLIVMSYENSRSLGSYISKRARRILPAYLCVIILSAVLGAALTEMPLAEYFKSRDLVRYLGFNSLFMNFNAPALPGVFSHNPIDAVNGSLWTLKIELMFYASVPILVWLCRKFNKYQVIAALYLLSVSYKVGLNWIADANGSDLLHKLAKQFPGQLAFFLCGSLLYYYVRDGRRLGILSLPIGLAAFFLTDGALHAAIAPVGVALAAIWFALFMKFAGDFGKFGDFSYGIYIYHFPMVQAAIALGFFSSAPVATVFLTAGLVLLVAVLSWHLIEKPALGATRLKHAGLLGKT